MRQLQVGGHVSPRLLHLFVDTRHFGGLLNLATDEILQYSVAEVLYRPPRQLATIRLRALHLKFLVDRRDVREQGLLSVSILRETYKLLAHVHHLRLSVPQTNLVYHAGQHLGGITLDLRGGDLPLLRLLEQEGLVQLHISLH